MVKLFSLDLPLVSFGTPMPPHSRVLQLTHITHPELALDKALLEAPEGPITPIEGLQNTPYG